MFAQKFAAWNILCYNKKSFKIWGGQMKKIPVIIDVDTGIDDAVAIALATYNLNLDVRAITCVAGNCSVGRVAVNTLNILQAINRTELLVAEGARKPLVRDREENMSYHGRTGLGEYKFEPLHINTSLIDAVTEMREIILSCEQKITLICLGPLTNIATLLTKYPEVKTNIELIAISGGLLDDDKNNPYPSFNVSIDPEAAEIVLKSGVNLRICPSDMGHIAYLCPQEIVKMSVLNKTGKMFETIFQSYHDRHVKVGAAMHDSCCVACISNPELMNIEKMHVELKMISSEVGVLDFDTTKPSNMEVVTQIHQNAFKKLFFDELNLMP